MPDTVERFTISIPPDLLARFDDVCAGKGYASRSEAVRDAIRDYLATHEGPHGGEDPEVLGTVSLLFPANDRHVADAVAREEQQPGLRWLCSSRVPAGGGYVLGVLVLHGSRSRVAASADRLISQRGVLHGRLVTAPAPEPTA